MANQYDPPLDYDFGLDFDYSVWTEESTITLCNVPWDQEYRDVVRFENRAALNAYIDSQTGPNTRIITDLSYIKPGMPVAIDLKHNVANKYNYIRVRNPLQPGNNDVVMDFFYFIQSTDYAASDTTILQVQLDLFQTYIYDITFGNAFIERGHIGIANENNFDSFGREYLTIPEGMNIGSEYQVITRRWEQIMGMRWDGTTMHDDTSIIAVSTQDLEQPPTRANPADPNTPLPNYATAKGGAVNSVMSGATLYAWRNSGDFELWLINNQNYPWRTQALSAIYIMPNLERYIEGVDWPTDGEPFKMGGKRFFPASRKPFPNWRDSSEILNYVGPRYAHLKKFWTSPYMVIEMTTFTATPIILKPESWATPDADFMERPNLTPPALRVDFVPRKYNALPGSPTDNFMHLSDAEIEQLWPGNGGRPYDIGDDSGEYLDMATRLTNFQSVPVVSNTGVAYLANNASSIHAQYAGADWSQQRALQGAQTSFDQASEAIDTSSFAMNQQNALMGQMNTIGNQRIINDTNIGTAQALVSGGPLNIIGSGLSSIANNARAIASVQSNNDTLAAQQEYNRNSTGLQNDLSRYNRDTNNVLALYAAKGDYAQAQLSLNAKVQDALSVQPTVNGQFGGDGANLANNEVGVSIRWKMIDKASMRAVGEFWLQFGYSVMQSVSKLPDDLMVMTKFTYWKCNKVYIRTGPMPEPHRQGIRGIMEKGVTVWKNPLDIGFTDFADNAPLEGISL